ncbi:MAG: enoyl-CoA hydratase [Inquilinus sp.]|nr:enoyl-CoA hydratase [Inquilinus sp.]
MTSTTAAESLTLPTGKILAHRDGFAGHVVFNNPERHNAVSLEMWDAAEQALSTFASDDRVRVVILSGAGGKAFVSGADISKFEKERGSKDATEHYNARLKVVYDTIEKYPKPTIAMIDGHCIGGGLNLAACCDLRLCSAKSRFAMPAAKLALGYPYDAIRRLINAVGAAAAKQLMFTAKSFDADTALRLGLVQEVADDALEARVGALAETIAGNAPLTIKAMKFISTQVLEPDPAKRDLSRCDELVGACFASEDYVEGRQAFMEKRKPQFQGR